MNLNYLIVIRTLRRRPHTPQLATIAYRNPAQATKAQH